MSGMFARLSAALLVFTAVVSGRAALSASQEPAPAASPLTFTEAQAERGNQVFGRVCLECHGRKDMSNDDFRVKWNGRTAFDLFDRIRSTMPEYEPGSLPRADYVDVTAYIGKLNGLAAGDAELTGDDATLKKQLLALK
jgi:hypothetical protein